MKTYIASGLAMLALGTGAVGGYLLLRPHDHLAEARALLAHGDLRGGALELRNAVMSNPGNAEAHFRLGLVDLRLEDPIAAETELNAARDHGWDANTLRAPLAEALLAQGRYADVLQRFTPDGLPPAQAAAVLVQRSGAQLGLGHVKEARAEAARALREDPRSGKAALAVAQAARAASDTEGATKAVAAALSIDPNDAKTLLLDAELRGRRGDAQGALRSLDAAVAAGPLWPVPRLARAQLLISLGEDARARADVDAVLKQDAQSPTANFLLAQILARARSYAAADTALELVGADLTQMPRGEYLQAVVKANLNEPEQAADAASSYLAHVPGDPAAYKLVARLDLSSRQPQQAIDVLDRAVSANRADAETLTLLGAAQAQAGQPAAAVSSLQRVAVLRPNDFATLAQLGALRLGAGDPAGAVRDLSQALAVAPATGAPSAAAAGAAAGELAQAAPGMPAPAPTAAPVPAPAAAAPAAAGPAAAAPTTQARAQAAAALVTAALRAGEPDKAAAALEMLRKLGAAPAELAELDGQVKLAKVDFAGALSAFAEVLRLDPAAIGARLQIARVLVLQGKQADAEKELADAVEAAPGNHEALSAYVALLVALGKNDAAIAAMQSAHAAAPADAVIGVGLADLYIRTGEPSRALGLLDDLDKARSAALDTSGPAMPGAQQQTQDLALLAARSRALVADGKRHDAVPLVQRLLAARPDDLSLRAQLIGLMLADGDAAGAQTVIQDGLTRQPNNPTLLYASVAAAAKSGGLQAGLDLADKLSAEPATGIAGKLLKGNLLMAQRHYFEAAAAYATYIDTESSPAFAVRAAEALVADKRVADARQLLHDWLAKHGESPDAAMLLASLDLAGHDAGSARKLLEEVVDKQPDNAGALNNLAWIEQQDHELGSARDLARRAWLLAPSPDSADTLGWILLQGDDPAPALDLLRLAAQAKPSDPTVQYHYALALKQAGQIDAARGILTRLASTPVDFDGKADAKKALDSLAQP
jgi:predicted Zn-dependent protease